MPVLLAHAMEDSTDNFGISGGVCIKRNLYLINYNHTRTQWTTKGNWDAGSSCSCDGGLHRYLRNFRGGLNPLNHSPRYATVCGNGQYLLFGLVCGPYVDK